MTTDQLDHLAPYETLEPMHCTECDHEWEAPVEHSPSGMEAADPCPECGGTREAEYRCGECGEVWTAIGTVKHGHFHAKDGGWRCPNNCCSEETYYEVKP